MDQSFYVLLTLFYLTHQKLSHALLPLDLECLLLAIKLSLKFITYFEIPGLIAPHP